MDFSANFVSKVILYYKALGGGWGGGGNINDIVEARVYEEIRESYSSLYAEKYM